MALRPFRVQVCVPILAPQARDCAVTRESHSVWRRVLGHNATLRKPRDLAACMLQVFASRRTVISFILPRGKRYRPRSRTWALPVDELKLKLSVLTQRVTQTPLLLLNPVVAAVGAAGGGGGAARPGL